ncbi:hypothetical protein Forpe1208_v010732 [Fusarium oxysporum f. sp. rapae]|uniref:Uncharacterized protein n=1 Tax=Fusarium oxysporum f. sp. rapae TaxID=485398 RepID=A0A8J5NRL7_FUSOX|nr:hypothetical protein Forpe1208_v010732 [Fusarium oxysporum f. sp. rapae]
MSVIDILHCSAVKARTRCSASKPTGGKAPAALAKASGKGSSSRVTKAARAAATTITPVKSPKPKLAQICKDNKDQHKRDKLKPRTAENHLVIPKEDLPPIISFTDDHFKLPCLGYVCSCLAGKGELEHCKADPTRRAARYALYKSSSYKCKPIYVLKKALLDDDENMISNARVTIRL